MAQEKQTILSIFAHPDDELGAIGTLANHVKNGDNVILVWTTFGELTSAFPEKTEDEVKEIRLAHARAIQRIIGAHDIRILDMGDMNVRVNRENTLKLAKLYSEFKPSGIITWDLYNRHPDHRNTAQLVIDAITFARIPKVLEGLPAHRENIPVFHYFRDESPLPFVDIDVTGSMDVVEEAVMFYAEVYGWKLAKEWVKSRRLRLGFYQSAWYGEKFNAYNWYTKPPTILPTRSFCKQDLSEE